MKKFAKIKEIGENILVVFILYLAYHLIPLVDEYIHPPEIMEITKIQAQERWQMGVSI